MPEKGQEILKKGSKVIVMTNSDDENDGISDEDKAIWGDYMDDEAPLSEEETSFEELLNNQQKPDDEERAEPPVEKVEDKIQSVERVKNITIEGDFQLDRRTDDRLRKGKIPIEARLDLHGMTKSQAHERLNIFIQKSFDKGLRHVLVITGKGKAKSTSNDWLSPSKGVLKENVPIWLSHMPLKKIILKYYTAQPKDGGSGALYVYLRRTR